MKVYVAVRYQGAENKHEIEALCAAVRAAGMKDFCFVRDVENYKHTFDDPKELWRRAYDEIGACDALLIDASDHPTGGRMIEVGIAYALRKRIFVLVRLGVQYKKLFDGVSSTVIEYETHKDITHKLKKYDQDSNFNFTDKITMLAALLAVGAIIGIPAWQISPLLGVAVILAYWLIIRKFFASVRDFDRVVIYIPLSALWIAGAVFLYQFSNYASWGYAITFWPVVLIVLRKLKFSL